jgi:hypothetical protein
VAAHQASKGMLAARALGERDLLRQPAIDLMSRPAAENARAS